MFSHGEIDPVWKRSDRVPILVNNQVVVWRFDPQSQQPYGSQLELLLSQEERMRLASFVDAKARSNFIVCRGILRFLLSCASGKATGSLRIQYGPQGKPELDLHSHQSPVCFNISHTEDLCVIVMSKNLEVGVDVEGIHEMKEVDRMARAYLTSDEYELWENGEKSQRLEKFYDYWCAKEAILKAAGLGLSIHPNQINTLEALSGHPIRGVQEDGCLFEFRDCQLIQLPLQKDFKGWLALFGNPEVIMMNEFSDQLLLDFGFE